MKSKRSGRKKSIILLSVISVLMVLSVLMTIVPLRLGINDYIPVIENISLGIDLKGGVYVVMEADNKDADGNVLDPKVYNDTLNGTITVLQNRLVGKGFTESTVVKQGDNRIRIEIPDVDDPEEVFNIIGKPAVLQFRDENENVILTGAQHLQSAFPTYDENGRPAVGLTLNSEGTQLFAKATRENINRKIRIYIDQDMVSDPTVQAEIANGRPIITNIGTLQQAEDFAMLLQSGSLPLQLNELEKGSISPTLGQDALRGGIIAGIIGLALVMLYMCIYYKGFGIISSISLVIYTVMLLYFLAGMPIAFSLAIIPQAQMTLPGIAGIILSIGMAIDANIIIFERIKDEYKLGKSIEASAKTGFRRAISAIADSNITTFVAGIVLYIFGQGTIKGFAHVLLVGIIISVICALVISRFLIKIFLGLSKSERFFGLKREGEAENKLQRKEFTIVQNKKRFFTVSLAIIFAGLLMTAIFGLNRGIDFTGGNIITASIGPEIEQGDNFSQISATINKSIDDYASENGLSIDKGVAQLAGSTSNKGITIRYNIRNIKDDSILSVKSNELNLKINQDLKAKIAELNIPDTNYKYDSTIVGSTISGELVMSAFYSVLIAAVLMLIYLAFRFELLMGAASVIALLHDVLIMIAFVAIFRYQINSSFIAAMITIIGYSINATIVIFDRVRENTKRLSMRESSYEEIGNKSIKETIMRSINTSITTMLTILLLFILGVPSIKEFAFPIMIGLIAGTYSSVFISVSVWVMLKNYSDKLKKERQKKEAAAAPAKAKTVKAN